MLTVITQMLVAAVLIDMWSDLANIRTMPSSVIDLCCHRKELYDQMFFL